MPPAPKASVIVTTYNRLDYLKQALESVLAQSITPQEIVVSDGGSNDGTLKWLRKNHPAVKIISAKGNPGPAVLMNLGLESTRGEFVTFLESDDFWRPSYLAQMLANIRRSTALCLHCAYTAIDSRGRIIIRAGRHKMPLCPPEILNFLGARVPVARALAGCTRLSFTVFRRKVFSQLGGFDPRFKRLCCDADFLFRIAENFGASAFSWLDKDLGVWRQHPNQLTALDIRSVFPDYIRLNMKHPPVLKEKISAALYKELQSSGS